MKCHECGAENVNEPSQCAACGASFSDIAGETVVTTFAVRTEGPQAGLATSMGIARFDWDGHVAYGPIDRCHTADVVLGR